MKPKILGDMERRVRLEMADIEDIPDLRSLKTTIENQIAELEELDFRLRSAKNSREDKNRKRREEELRPRLLKYVKTYLKPGMRVWMKGCRDKHGFREVLELKHIDTLSTNPIIVCRQINKNRKYKNGKWQGAGTEFIIVETKGQITEHYFDKLIGIERKWPDGSESRIPIRKILDVLSL